jgi:hypothetical protein
MRSIIGFSKNNRGNAVRGFQKMRLGLKPEEARSKLVIIPKKGNISATFFRACPGIGLIFRRFP